MFLCSLVLTVLLFGNIESNGYYANRNTHNDKFLSINKYPTVVALNRLTNDGRILPYCGGNIIHRSRVLTSALCVINSTDEVDLTGIFVLSEAVDLRLSKVHKVKSALVHPEYHHEKETNDVAILTIEGSFSKYITPIKLDKDKVEKPGDCDVVGWSGTYLEKHYDSNIYVYGLTKNEETNRIINSKFDCEDKCLQNIISVDRAFRLCNEEVTDTQNKSVNNNQTRETSFDRTCTWNQIENGAPIICNNVYYGIIAKTNPTKMSNRLIMSVRVSPYIEWIEESLIRLDINEGSINETSPVVSIYRKSVSSKWYPYCGGTIIHRYTVLTAASCLINLYEQPEVDGIFVLSGSTDLRFSNAHKVVDMSLHPEYDQETGTNDIGLILIDEPFEHEIVPMKLAIDWNVTQILSSSCEIFGWGFEDLDSSPNFWHTLVLITDEHDIHKMIDFYSRYRFPLYSASVATIPAGTCARLLGNTTNSTIEKDKGQFCTYRGLYEKCHGQSGDPIICSGTQYGIVSWGYGCGLSIDHPVVITGVGYYIDWILDETINLQRKKPT